MTVRQKYGLARNAAPVESEQGQNVVLGNGLPKSLIPGSASQRGRGIAPASLVPALNTNRIDVPITSQLPVK
jgi:hypothetical protein